MCVFQPSLDRAPLVVLDSEHLGHVDVVQPKMHHLRFAVGFVGIDVAYGLVLELGQLLGVNVQAGQSRPIAAVLHLQELAKQASEPAKVLGHEGGGVDHQCVCARH